jgi:NAD(P)-dependent dehydrogenase (short-subunit alcohol dehydrogenase family)
MFRFDEKVIVVTGGSLGIGKAAARAFAERGGRVVMASRDAAAGERAAAEIGAGSLHIRADISQEAEVEALLGEALRRFGRLDVLVNNAGIYVQGDVSATTLADWDRIMAVNLTGPFLCTKHSVAALSKTRGVVVNVASEAGLVGIAGQVAYNTSKAGVIALTRSCAVDLAPRGIRVNCVCPGTTATPLVEAAVQRAEDPVRARRRLEETRPLNRLGTPEEIAAAILYLASAEAGYASGAVLSIDGGYTAQ